MATTTITTTAAQDQRLSSAFGILLGLTNGGGAPRGATQTEIKQQVINYLTGVVLQVERQQAQLAITDTPFTPT